MTGRVRRTTLAGVLGLALVAGGAAPASAAWSAPVAVSPDGADGSVQALAVGPTGEALVAWVRSTVVPRTARVQLRRRSAAGVLGPVLTVSPATVAAGDALVGVDGAGDAWVAWQYTDAALDVRLQARRVFRTGTLGPVLDVSPAGVGVVGPRMAVDPAGDAVFGWQQLGAAPAVTSRRVSAGGVLGPVRPLARTAAQPHDLTLRAYPDGSALTVWADLSRVLGRVLDPAGVPGPVRVLYAAPSPNDAVRTPRLSVDGAGQALVTWLRVDSVTLLGSGMARTASPALVLGPVGRVTPAGQDVTDVMAGTDAAGGWVLLWSDWATGNAAQARRLTAAGALGPVVVLGTGYPRAVALGPGGAGAVVWEGPSADRAFSHTVWAAAVTPAAGGAAAGPAVELRRGAELPTAAATDTGRVLLAFQQPGTAWIRTWVSTGP